MSLDVRIKGAVDLHKAAAQIRAEGNKDLAKEMSRGLSRAIEPVRKKIRSSAGETMPREGGYNAAFDKSLRFRMAHRNGANQSALSLTTFADGSSERRDIRSLEGGNLRHPVFGRSRPGPRKGERTANPWSVTKIRDGFWKRGTDSAMDEVEKEIGKVADGLLDRLAGK